VAPPGHDKLGGRDALDSDHRQTAGEPVVEWRQADQIAPQDAVPGHNALGGNEILRDLLTYLEELRDETWVRRDSAMREADIIAEVSDVLIKRHPDWAGREWLAPGISCLCAEHARHK